ncbi:MAG TPA: protein kinase [Kofleriaceae bacterium]|nr:protein kinase [Kofleriaceae bacterium]
MSELDTSDIRHGSKVGRFVVEGQLGAGGMGVVYAAHDRELDRRVALKVLKGTDDAEQRTRLMREGQAMARVTHENVITVHEVGMEGSMVFLAQELLDGGSLRQWLEKKHTQGDILAKFIAAGRGLAAAHRAGLVHRDFKPDNVLLGKDGRVRVSDFGLARSVDSVSALAETQRNGGSGSTHENLSNPMLTMTRTGAVMGTPLYMSPEQHAGEGADARSDQFSFCVALYEALHGDTPFPGKTAVALADAVMSGRMKQPPKNADVSARIRKILLRGLATKPADRYPSMDALLADLTRDPSRKARRFFLLTTVVVLIAGAVVGGYAFSKHETNKATEVPARRTIAVLGFKNVAKDPSIEWISQGMSQLLVAQLAADDVKLVSAEEALRARSELHLPDDAISFGPDTLTKIRERLGADAVVGGSYIVSNGALTLNVVVQDIPRNKAIPIKVDGTTSELPKAADDAGVEIRKALGISSVAIVKNNYDVLPRDPTAVREYVEGKEALRLFDFRNAKTHLLAATKAEPDFAPGHLALAQAYEGLFDAEKSQASAKQALATAKSLSVDQQMAVARDAYKVLGQLSEARDQASRLFALHPDRLDDGLALAKLQEPDDAVRTLASLRKLPPPAGTDPRIDIVEGRAELDRQALPRALELAKHATQEATTRNAAVVAADGRELEGEALVASGELAAAQDAFEDARKRFEAVKDPMGTLTTLDQLASLALERGELDGALKTYDALAALREQAGQAGAAARASAGAAYALALRGKNTEAEKRLARAEKTAADDPIAIPTIDLVAGVLAWAKGDGPGALGRLDKCNARFATVAPAQSTLCLLLRGEIQAELGDADTARKTFEDAKAAADKAGNVYRSQQAELRLAQLELDEESAADAEAKIADQIVERAGAIRIAAAAHGASSLEARSGIMLARARIAQGNSQDALEAISKVLKQEDLRIEVDRLITEALAKDAQGDATSRDTLDEVKKIADKQGCVTLQLEARLALAQVLSTSKEATEQEKGKADLLTIQQDAKDKNLGRIAKRAEILAQP